MHACAMLAVIVGRVRQDMLGLILGCQAFLDLAVESFKPWGRPAGELCPFRRSILHF